ncbi:hypothetical protein Btru_014009 [Bulinus truncatus]|nr:hypothetical protein Btru_014009 [Bulinus truncatus]
MSSGLVAYGASDDSDASDSDNEKLPVSKTSVVSGHISDEDEFPTVSSTSAPIYLSSTNSKDNVNASDGSLSRMLSANIFDNNVNSTSLSSLEDLPAPQPLSASLSDTVEDELEDEVKPKAAEIANAQLPPNKKVKQPVKITIPSLNKVDDESSPDKTTSASSSSKKTGLFALLPAPMHSAKKEVNRPLIPHSVAKKPVTKPIVEDSNLLSSSSDGLLSKKSTTEISSKHMTTFNALTGFESDSEDEEYSHSSTNFFSLSSSSDTPERVSSAIKAQGVLQIEEVSSSETETSASVKDITSSDSADPCTEEPATSVNMDPEPGSLNDAPLVFNSINQLRSWPGTSYGFLPPVGPSGPVTSAAYTSFDSSFPVPSNSQYNLADAEGEDKMDETEQGTMEDDDLMKFMNDREFQRLQGKRKRGSEEAINFVDANVDDYVDPTEVSKHLTEESSYVSHKKKDNTPTAQQRRKKQITYLAYQAKEREMELKNTWAQNRLTKKQTQSKYGF